MKRTMPLDPPPDLRLTLGRLNGGTGHPVRGWRSDEGWRASRTPAGPSTIHLRIDGTRIEAEAWGPGAAWELEHLPDLLGSATPVDDFPGNGHRLMRDLQARFRGLRMARTNRIHEALVPVILGQVVTRREAGRAERALIDHFGEPAPGPGGLRLQPSPQVLAALRYEDYHPLGIGRKKADLIIAVSRRARRLEQLATLAPAVVDERLRSLPGIGPWSAALVVGEALGEADAVPVGDYHLPNTVAWALAGEDRATDERMLELLEPYRPYRYRAALMLKLAGIAAPKYGPKTEVRAFARY